MLTWDTIGDDTWVARLGDVLSFWIVCRSGTFTAELCDGGKQDVIISREVCQDLASAQNACYAMARKALYDALALLPPT